MNQYLAGSLGWSLVWFFAGTGVGYMLRNEISATIGRDSMTTPERLRRRQRIEGSALIVLGIVTLILSLYFRHQDLEQRHCFSAYIAQNSQTSQIRADLVRRESDATRKIIIAGLSAKSMQELKVARRHYLHDLHAIDAARAENPIKPFRESTCGS